METVIDTIEKIFCEPFEKLPKYQMDEDTTSLLLTLLMSEPRSIPEKEQPFLFKLISKRVECFTYKMTDTRAILFLCVVSKSPGGAVMYLTYLQYWAKKHNRTNIDLNDLCEIFPMGFPSEEALSDLWRKQKVASDGSDNLLDHVVWNEATIKKEE